MCLYGVLLDLLNVEGKTMSEREDDADIAADILEELGFHDDAALFRWWAGMSTPHNRSGRVYHDNINLRDSLVGKGHFYWHWIKGQLPLGSADDA